MKRKDKAHLLYMTGLSVDKNRMNNITENINFDKDYTFLLEKAQKNLEGAFEKKNVFLSKGVDFLKKVVKQPIDLVPDVNIIDDTSRFNTYEDMSNDIAEEYIAGRVKNWFSKKYIDPAIEKPATLIGYKNIDTILADHKSLSKIMRQYTGKVKTYVNSDFFSLYMANQSDSMGVQPLSKLSSKLPFNIEHSYCDWDYYDNKYIDHIVLKVNTTKLKSNWDLELSKTFNTHVNDILLSRIIEEEKIHPSKKSKSNKTLSLMDLVLGNNVKYTKSDILKTLSDRNFFGISLLSQVLYTIKKLSNNDQVFNIDNMEDVKDTNSGQYHFLKELLEMACDPNMTIKKTDNSKSKSLVSAKIYFSDGVRLTKKTADLIDDEFFLYTNKEYSNSETSLYNGSSNKKSLKEKIEKYSIHTILRKNEKNTNLVNYIHSVGNNVYIKVPIKMMISLPLDTNEKVDSELYLPSCLVDEKENVIDVLTVGGAEHNRALSHLINKHRLKYKDERLFGFMDNYFDFEHKIMLDSNQQGIHTSVNFFMGINQPVSGWNYLLTKREDDAEGNSLNSDVKFITFKLTNKKQKINIVSIYGFSAIASVLGTNLFIEEIRHLNINTKKGIFSGNFTSFFSSSNITNSRGTASTIFFYKNLYDVYNQRELSGSLYNKLQITLKNFTEDEEKQLRSKLGKTISKLIVKKPNKSKYNLEIDIDFENKEEKWILRDKLDTLRLQDIKLNQIKLIVRFFFENKSYLNVFNNDLKKYSKVLHFDNGKNHLLICDIKQGTVSATN